MEILNLITRRRKGVAYIAHSDCTIYFKIDKSYRDITFGALIEG